MVSGIVWTAGLCLILWASLSSRTAAAETFVPDGRLHPDDYTVLMAADIPMPAGMKVFQPGSHGKFYAENWKSPGHVLRWEILVTDEDAFAVSILLKRDSAHPLELNVACGDQTVTGTLPAGIRGWVRQSLDGTLRLAKGKQPIALTARSSGATENFAASIFSVELVRPAMRARLHEAAVKLRADTKWLQEAKYGLMFHWTSQTVPHHGEPKPYAQAVRDFDVPGLVEQVRLTGAGFIVLTTSHAQMFFPAPLKSLDRLLPGRTTSRDLVTELADALGKHGIKLMLYYHIGSVGDPEWLKASGFWKTDTTQIFDSWSAVIGEIGERYGEKLAGWWFDDGTINYYYRGAPWERLTRTAKTGHPQRLVAYNPWELPSCTGFQDYFCGEGFSDPAVNGLPLGPDGHFTGGSHEGLQACATLITEGDWVHTRKETDVGAPQWNAAQMAGLLKGFMAKKNVPIFNLEIYQEGAVSPRSVEMFRQARAILDGKP
jgi:hypothetical protein